MESKFAPRRKPGARPIASVPALCPARVHRRSHHNRGVRKSADQLPAFNVKRNYCEQFVALSIHAGPRPAGYFPDHILVGARDHLGVVCPGHWLPQAPALARPPEKRTGSA
jgi:hypothetical protein